MPLLYDTVGPYTRLYPPPPSPSPRYANADGTVITPTTPYPENVAITEYIGADGLEEMHVFIGLAWFDMGSWAWAHYIAEWGTKGIFQVGSARILLFLIEILPLDLY